MERELLKMAGEAEAALAAADSLEEVNEIRIRFLGKKGELTRILRGLGELPPEERPRVGQVANEVRQAMEMKIATRVAQIKEKARESRLHEEKIDVTLPGTRVRIGHLHPLTLVRRRIEDIFLGLGFEIVEGPEVELDYYNFEALNIPRDHPARDMQDTFFVEGGILLRTHTSPVQVRTMERMVPRLPVKVIAPGKVYRRDDDATHSPMFHQVEGLLLDKRVTFGDLKGVLQTFAAEMFGASTRTRFRPSFFPFTEPSAEMDISCVICGGRGCRTCSYSGWLEILGCGSVHPRVLEMSGYNSEEITGFAFGMGIERITMLKYGIDDLRLFFDNDLRFLEQF